MQQRKWHALGEALTTLRKSKDLGQKEVIERSGEEIGERTLRGYERGEQRPGRERLLRLLIRSFDLRGMEEVNRHLQLGDYASLSGGEIRQFELSPLPAGRPVSPSASVGRPTDFRVEVSTLIVTDGRGREIWQHEFPTRLAGAAYEHQSAIKRCAFADIDGDGGIETLFVYAPLDFGSVGATLLCFGEDGSLKWEFVPGKTVRDTTGREYTPPYFISNVQIIPIGQTHPRILVSSNHYLHNPNQIAMLDPNGELVGEYWHSGHLLYIAHADINADGIEELLLAGVNNGYRQATMVIFDPRHVDGVSSQPGRQILGLPPGTEKAIVLFPRTCLSKNSPYNRVMELRVTREKRIMLAVAEGVSEARNPGVMVYELDFALKVLNARPDSHLQESHRMLEIGGELDHSWTDEETDVLRSQVVVTGGL